MNRLCFPLCLLLSLFAAEAARSQGTLQGLSHGCPLQARTVELLQADRAKALSYHAGAAVFRRSGTCSFLQQAELVRGSAGVHFVVRQDEEGTVEAIFQTWDGDEWVDAGRTRTVSTSDERGLLVEEVTQNWDGSTWVNASRVLYTAEGDIAELVMQTWEDDEWVNLSRFTWEYDEAGQLVREISYQWDGREWENWARTLNEYDAEGNRTETVTQEWEGNRWEDTARYRTAYDEEGRATEVVSDYYTFLVDDADNARDLYTYDDEGRVVARLYQHRDSNGDWADDTYYSFTYDPAGNLVEEFMEQLPHETGTGTVFSRLVHTYDAQGNRTSTLREHNLDGSWTRLSMTTRTYDQEGNLLEEVFQLWDGEDWENRFRTVFIYPAAAPEAVADAMTTEEDSPIEIDVLANDAGAEDATVTITDAPQHGEVTVNEDGTLTYIPEEGFSGTDTFTYAIDNGTGTAEATVTVTVTEVNDAPSSPVITEPADEATLTIGGAQGEAPADPSTTITITVEDAEDAEGDPLSYRWELALDPAFEEIIATAELEVEPAASKVELEVTYGMIAEALDEAGVELGDEVELYHRVVASDGEQETASEAFQITLVRGTLVGAEGRGELPETFALHAAYPNPFNPETTIAFDVAQAGPVRLVVYDVLGRQVAVLEDGEFGPGRYTTRWEAGSAPSGVYLVRMEAAGQRHTQRVVVAR